MNKTPQRSEIDPWQYLNEINKMTMSIAVIEQFEKKARGFLLKSFISLRNSVNKEKS